VKVFISVDMEGVTGVTDPEDVLPDGADYERGRVFMTIGYHSCAGTDWSPPAFTRRSPDRGFARGWPLHCVRSGGASRTCTTGS